MQAEETAVPLATPPKAPRGASQPARERPMRYEFTALSDTGRVRQNNEDSVQFDTDCGVAVLADGMGGYNAGEVASEMASTTITLALSAWMARVGPNVPVREAFRAMESVVAQANRDIFEAANAHPSYAGMGTTLVAGIFLEHSLVLGHIGDSRAYRWRRGVLTQLTRDHSLLQEQLDAGLITPAEAATSGNRNLVTRALGVEEYVELEVHEHRVEPGDLYLFCSDGLTDMVEDAAIAVLMGRNEADDARARRLVEHANACGGRDNISVLLARAGASGDGTPGFMARLLGK